MKIEFADQILQVDPSVLSVEQLFEQINQIMTSANAHFSHLVVDGVEIYEDHYDYILERYSTIEKINVKTMTLRELADDALLTTEDYLKRALPEIKSLADNYYQVVTESTWDKFEQFVEGFQWVVKLAALVAENQETYQNGAQYVNIVALLKEKTLLLDEAVQQSDMIAIGDVIQYEVVPAWEMLLQEVEKTIEVEVVRHDLN